MVFGRSIFKKIRNPGMSRRKNNSLIRSIEPLYGARRYGDSHNDFSGLYGMVPARP